MEANTINIPIQQQQSSQIMIRQASYTTRSIVSSYNYHFQMLQERTHLDPNDKNYKAKFYQGILQIFKSQEEIKFDDFLMKLDIKFKRVFHQQNLRRSNNSVYQAYYVFFVKEMLGFFSFIAQNTSNKTREEQIIAKNMILFIGANKQNEIKAKQPIITLYLKISERHSNLTIPGSQISNYSSNSINHEKNLSEYLNRIIHTNPKLSIITSKNGFYFYVISRDKCLGTGGFGDVFYGQSIKLIDNSLKIQPWAVKQYKKNIDGYITEGYVIGQDREHLMLDRISRILKKLQNTQGAKHIIQLKQVLTYEDKRYVVYELCEKMNLKSFIKNSKKYINKMHIVSIIYQLLSTLKLLHYDLIGNNEQLFTHFSIQNNHDTELQRDLTIYKSMNDKNDKIKGIIHRDIKTNNVLIKRFNPFYVEVKLIDWAFSKRTFSDETICETVCGTPNYQAPQFASKQKRYGCKADVWSFGALTYQLFKGDYFAIKSGVQNMEQVKKKYAQKINKLDFDEKSFSEKEILFWRQFLMHSMNNNYNQRYSSKQLFEFLMAQINENKLYSIFTSTEREELQFVRHLYSNFVIHRHQIEKRLKYAESINLKQKILLHVQNFILESFDYITKINTTNMIVINYEDGQLITNMRGLMKQKANFQQITKPCINLQLKKSLQKMLQNDYKDIKEVTSIIVKFQEVLMKHSSQQHIQK